MRAGIIAVLFCVWMLPALRVDAQTAPTESAWALTESCAAQSVDAPDGLITGVIASYQRGEGARAYREAVGTTYYLAFEGSAFTESGALSPDGRHYAVPYGSITTFAAFDVRYRVSEIWVYTTESVPRLIRRIPWGATFQRGDVPRMTWLDDQTLLYPEGNIDAPTVYYTLDPFAENITRAESTLGGYVALSPDARYGIALHEGGYALMDAAAGTRIRRLEGLSDFVWHPDSRRYTALHRAADGTRHLMLIDAADDTGETIFTLDERYALRGLRWSSDGERLLFGLFDPQENETRLIVGDASARTLTDVCVLLKVVDARDGAAAVFAPAGDAVALLTASGDYRFRVLDLESNTLYGISGDSGALTAWGAG